MGRAFVNVISYTGTSHIGPNTLQVNGCIVWAQNTTANPLSFSFAEMFYLKVLNEVNKQSKVEKNNKKNTENLNPATTDHVSKWPQTQTSAEGL